MDTNWLLKWNYLKGREAEALNETTGPDYTELCVALCRSNLPLFDILFMGRDPAPHIPLVWNEVKDDKRVVLELARDHLKTSKFVVAKQVHRICYGSLGIGSNPRILVVNETAGQAAKTYTEIKNRLVGAHSGEAPKNLIGEAFGDFSKKMLKSSEGAVWFDLGQGVDRDPTLESVGFEGAITGGHPTDCSFDDLDSFETSRTPDRRDNRWTLFNNTFEGLFSPSTNVMLSATPKNDEDVRGRLKKTGFYKSVRHPAMNRFPEEADFEPVFGSDGKTRIWTRLTEHGLDELQAFWPCPQGQCPGPECADGQLPGIPFHRSSNYLIHAKHLPNPFTYATEFMLDSRSGDEQPIKKSMLRFFSLDESVVGKTSEWNDSEIVAFPKGDIQDSVHSWDHALSQGRRADNTAVAQMYRDSKNNVYCIVSAGRWDPATVVQMMEMRYTTDPFKRPSKVVTEAIGFQRMFGDQVTERAGGMVPIVPVKAAKGKLESMIENGYLAHLMNHRIFLNVDEPDTIREHLMFSGSGGGGAHDDRVDACRLGFGELCASSFIDAGISRGSNRSRHR